MRGLNSKEKQREINRIWFLAAWFSMPRDLVDTLFSSHNYSRYHLSVFSTLSLVFFALLSIKVVFASARWVQRLSAILLVVCCLTAIYTRNLSLEIPGNQHLLKKLIALWAIAIVMGLSDWLFFQRYFQGARKASLSDFDTFPRFNGFSDPMDSPEDRARSQIFSRLRHQAQTERVELTELDFRMIDYSRIASRDWARPLEEDFYFKKDYWLFKEEIIHLLENAIRQDADQDALAMKRYRLLKRDLKKGGRDQQLVMYLGSAILEARTQIQKALEFSAYIAIGCVAVSAVYFAVAHFM